MGRILLQETDSSVLEVLTLALEYENFIVYALQDSDADFISLIDSKRPHVVVLDFRIDVKSVWRS
ncbi:hypothetical protein SAMN04488023_11039 [Pedobacter rhizosphaerae]|uniref:Response regulatory domain-containing protein n=1 Tax=Pedobacter rhizosphaerae TaxID=390241 RepID=A0A1H9PN89_9SPHI|nr:hypothetical protein SAMN04488023_11039 [Pedobacter rhizosphaerae]